MKASFSAVQRSEAASMETVFHVTPTLNERLLFKLIVSQEAGLDHFMQLSKFMAFLTDHSPKKRTSSKNCNSVICIALSSTLVPLKMPFSLASNIIAFNVSAAIRKRNGETGSPCRRPLSIENSIVGLPFTSTETAVEEKQPRIYNLHFSVNFICFIIESRKS